MTTNNNNPNVYPKGSTYTLEEFIPVVRAAQKMGLTEDAVLNWFQTKLGCGWQGHLSLRTDREPYTLLQDIPIPQPEPPKPLTVEKIKAATMIWYLSPDTNVPQTASTWTLKAGLIAYGIPCYETEDDCKRAQELGVE